MSGFPFVLSSYGLFTLCTVLLWAVHPMLCQCLYTPCFPHLSLMVCSLYCSLTWYTQHTDLLSMPVNTLCTPSCHLRYTQHTVSPTWQSRSLAFPVSDPHFSVLHRTDPTLLFAISLHATSCCKNILGKFLLKPKPKICQSLKYLFDRPELILLCMFHDAMSCTTTLQLTHPHER